MVPTRTAAEWSTGTNAFINAPPPGVTVGNCPCNLPWGGSIAHGANVTAYSSTAPAAACSTVQETRTCSNGTLSGSFTNQSCTNGCTSGTTNNCDYTANAHGGSSGTCASGYTGACSYSCSNGTRSLVSNTCVLIDTTPNAFTFTDVTGQALNALITSNTISIGGINSSTPVSVSGDGGPQVSINGGAWGTSGNITNGQSLVVRLTSANAASTARTATVNVGGVTDTWSVTTASAVGCTTNANCSAGGQCLGPNGAKTCWYMGNANQSCTTVCSTRGGYNTATVT